MIWLYGLTPPGAPPDPERLAAANGVTGEVRRAETPCGWLVHGPATDAEIPPKRRHLLAHTRVLEAIGAEVTLLPMRFGMVAEDVGEVEAMLARDAAAVARAFERIDNHVEIGLRVGFDRDAALAATLAAEPALSGQRDRLAALARTPQFEAAEFGRRLGEALARRRSEVQRRLVRALAPDLAAHALKAPEHDAEVLALDALVPRGSEDALATAAAEAAAVEAGFAGGAEPQVRLVGPVPPFTFADLALGRVREEA